ncbi:minor tail protein [Mycobacterium phage Miramae]|uniref:Minor tail protein n=1 Tax=Mycobacterium phage Miramae TaxID=2517961 RepID=A0A482JGV1_9CAUD|nr:minor tail protein [Mycobacterium phage Miramae]QBP31419.1 minor tail protein [Mycobacterium phage Miramae]QBP32416.1 minor tail protein [Mycobacterium phage AvatarAhPeg]
MTTPHQPPPGGELAKWLGSGAFVVGGGDSGWGQDYDERAVRSLFEVPFFNMLNALDVLREQLLKLPVDALKMFLPLIPGAVESDFNDVTTAVGKIIAALTDGPAALMRGEFLEWIGGTFNVLSTEVRQILEILAGFIVTPINSAVQAVKDWWNSIMGKTQKLGTDGKLAADQLTGTVPTTQVGGFGGTNTLADGLTTLVDNTVKAAGNILGSNFGLQDLFDTLRGMQSNIADANAALAQLQAEQTGSANSGKRFFVNFGDYDNANSVPSIFTEVVNTGPGSVATVDGQLQWLDSGNTFAQRMYLYNVDQLMSDYFEVSFVMPRRSEDEGPFNIFQPSYDYAIGRSNASGSRFCFARVGYGRARMGCVVDGTTTLFGTADISFAAPAGARVKFRGGTAGGVRVFQLLVNNSIIGTVTDTGNVSFIGDTYRRVGLGFEAVPRGSGQGTPGTISAFSANDNAPQATVGTSFRAYRAATAAINKTSGVNVLPANCIDTVDHISGDLTWTPATQRLTYNGDRPKTFLVGMRVKANATIPSAGNWTQALYKNGSLYARLEGHQGHEDTSTNNDNENRLTFVGGGTPMVQMNPGDYIAFGFENSATIGIIGSGDGSQTWVNAIGIG